MWRWVTRGLVLTFVGALLAPALLAQSFVGELDLPNPDPTVQHSGVILVRGWALDPGKISKIELYVDDKFVHKVPGNLPRVDIVEAFPSYPGIAETKPGFQTGFLASNYSSGPHTVEVRVTSALTNEVQIVGRRTIQINNSINQSPFGSVDIPDANGIHNANGAFPVLGWAADTDGIERIEVMMDGGVMNGAIYGDPRPDVALAYPDFPAAEFSGFVANVDTTRVPNGVHLITVNAIDKRGLSRMIGRRQVQVINNADFLRPFGHLDEPRRDTVLHGTLCGGAPPIVSPYVRPLQHITPVRGWALDLSTRTTLGAVTYVELLVDGVRWASTDDCGLILGEFANCYGLPRYDVARFYPTYNNSPRSGFLFTLDVGALIASGVRQGNHSLKVRVGDDEQTFAELPNKDGIPVWFQCSDLTNDFASLGFIEFPVSFDYVSGDVTFRGWALDQNIGVTAVEIIIDGNYVGQAQYGFARTDIAQAYPYIFNARDSGWRFTMDTKKLTNARHRLTVRVLDQRGFRSEIGSVDFYTANNPTP
ncbi:MAG: Ig-like domain-containing protein [Thermoanaerobaculia bacterium]